MTLERTVAVLLFDQVNALDVAGPLEAFAVASDAEEGPAYRTVVWSFGSSVIRSESGLKLASDGPPPVKPEGDLLLVPGGAGARDPRMLVRIADWLRAHHFRFKRIAAICTGAYALAEAGLLDGRCAATHWAHVRDLQRRYPKVRVTPDALFVADGRFHTSGGVTAGIDLALDLIERDAGPAAAMRAARQLVVFLRRSGAQAQFSTPLQVQTAATGRLAEVCRWAAAHLDADLSVDALAARAGLSPRQLARRFQADFGATPAAYVQRLRLDAARTLLAQGAHAARVAHAVGFASEDGFRRAFQKRFGVSPVDYRRRFGPSKEDPWLSSTVAR